MSEQHHQTLNAPICMMCAQVEPKGGWHTIGCNDGDPEFFCSSECFNDSCDYHDDGDDDYE